MLCLLMYALTDQPVDRPHIGIPQHSQMFINHILIISDSRTSLCHPRRHRMYLGCRLVDKWQQDISRYILFF